LLNNTGKNNMRVLILTFLIFLNLSCISKKDEQLKAVLTPQATDYTKSYVDFKNTLTVLNDLGRLDNTSDRIFWKIPLTQELYGNSAELMHFHRQIWRDPSVSEELKIQSTKLAQCLSKKERLILIDAIFLDFKAGVVPDYLVTSFLSPGSEWSTWLDLNHEGAEVQNTLRRIFTDIRSSKEIIETTKSILDGTGAEFIREYGNDVAQKLRCVHDQDREQ
jgi:hypothetical protein